VISNTLLPGTLNPDEAIQMQDDLRKKLVLTWDGREVNIIAGIVIHEISDLVVAAIELIQFPDLTPINTFIGKAPPAFPYIPGLLVYRVGPAILNAWQKVTAKPDLIMVNAHGTAHPRGMGLASHIGVWLNIPTIGVAKTLLYGCESNVNTQLGDWSELLDEHNSMRVIGAVLRTCENAKPVYVSPGHLIDLPHSIDFTLACCRDHRLPEPIRFAQQAASAHIKIGSEKLISEA
jgi:deoxyribonuclease V